MINKIINAKNPAGAGGFFNYGGRTYKEMVYLFPTNIEGK